MRIKLAVVFMLFTSLLVILIHNKNAEFISHSKYWFKEEINFPNDLKKLSIILQTKMRELGQQSCRNATSNVSVNGGWCLAISDASSVEHYTDEKLVPYLSKFLEGK